jgi:hypothetical protein
MHYLNRQMYLFSQKFLQHLFKRFLQGNQSVNYVISNPITIILDIKLYYTKKCSCFRMPSHYYIIYFDGQRPHICNLEFCFVFLCSVWCAQCCLYLCISVCLYVFGILLTFIYPVLVICFHSHKSIVNNKTTVKSKRNMDPNTGHRKLK